MKDHPILFSDPMVRAILEGRKTQTRRVVKGAAQEAMNRDVPHLEEDGGARWLARCPYGQPGDRLWVREAAMIEPHSGSVGMVGGARFCRPGPGGLPQAMEVKFRADYPHPEFLRGWTPSIHMPRWASRITLEITGIRFQRLQDIGQGDACAEGCPPFYEPIDWYSGLWEELNGPGSWQANPWVWVVEFKRIEADRKAA